MDADCPRINDEAIDEKLGVGDSADGLSHDFEKNIGILVKCSAALDELDRML